MKVAVARHGQTDWNIQRRYQGWQGLRLNETGRAQAIQAADQLRAAALRLNAHWQWLTSSDAERAVETAELIGAEFGVRLGERVPELIERGFGAAEGESITLARLRWPLRDYPGGEAMSVVRQRAMTALNSVAANHSGQDGIVVTHGTVLRVIVDSVTGLDPGSLPNAAIAVLDGTPGNWQVALTSWQQPIIA